MTTASSGRSSGTDGSTNLLKTGSPTAIRGSSSGPNALRHRLRRLGRNGASRRRGTRHIWHPAETVEAVGYDTPIVGWRGKRVNTLRLWSARAVDPCGSTPSTPATMLGAIADRCGPRRSARCSTRRTRRRPGRSCGCGRSISSRPPPCQDLVRPPRQTFKDMHHAPDKTPPSSSTIRTRDRDRGADARPASIDRARGSEAWALPRGHVLLHEPHASA